MTVLKIAKTHQTLSSVLHIAKYYVVGSLQDCPVTGGKLTMCTYGMVLFAIQTRVKLASMGLVHPGKTAELRNQFRLKVAPLVAMKLSGKAHLRHYTLLAYTLRLPDPSPGMYASSHLVK